MLPTTSHDAQVPRPQTDEPSRPFGGRLHLVTCRIERHPSARSRVVVEFRDGTNDAALSAHRDGATCPAGDLRLAAQATLDVVHEATRGLLRVELIGAKVVRAFDTNIVVVAAQATCDGRSTRIIGSVIADEDLLVASARATLHAVNRLVSPLLGPGADQQ